MDDGEMSRDSMRTAIVLTVLNESSTLPRLFDGIRGQLRAPDEIVIADGGSTDGTLEVLSEMAREFDCLRVLDVGNGTIGAGRNAAIAAARSPYIAVTDAGCSPDPRWLEAIAESFAGGAQVVSGIFRPVCATRFERMVQALLTRPVTELTEAWNPSSRSMGFLRSAWEKVGGYPEELPTAEDTVFCERLREAGYAFALAREAVVSWWPRSSFRQFVLQYARYAYGDGLSRTSAPHYRWKAFFYSLVVLGIAGPPLAPASVAGPLRLAIPLLIIAVLCLYHLRYGVRMIRRGAGVLSLLYEPVLMTSYDLSEIVGYLSGSFRRRSGRRL